MNIVKLFFVFTLFLLVLIDSHAVYADDPTPTPTPGPCTDTVPTDAPNLYQITPGSSSATLFFAPPSSAYTGFIISYGLDSNADTYNATLSQGVSSGAITYTVNSLTPDTKYYFKVQAINNCATGPFSSVLSTTATSAGTVPTGTSSNPTGNSSGSPIKTPVTGPEDVIYFGLASLLVSLGGFGIFLKNK